MAASESLRMKLKFMLSRGDSPTTTTRIDNNGELLSCHLWGSIDSVFGWASLLNLHD